MAQEFGQGRDLEFNEERLNKAFDESEIPVMSASMIAEAIGMSRQTVHRVLETQDNAEKWGLRKGSVGNATGYWRPEDMDAERLQASVFGKTIDAYLYNAIGAVTKTDPVIVRCWLPVALELSDWSLINSTLRVGWVVLWAMLYTGVIWFAVVVTGGTVNPLALYLLVLGTMTAIYLLNQIALNWFDKGVQK